MLNDLLGRIRDQADTAYCEMIEQARKTECLGWEAKVKAGEFGRAELEAHGRCGELLGRHRALHDAARMIEDAMRPN